MTKTAAPTWANAIVGYHLVPPDQLLAHPANPRRHPAAQRDALRASLRTLGWVAPVLQNVRTGHLIDGHARIEEALSAGVPEVPVIDVDLSPEQEAVALATLDPIAAMASRDREALDALLREIDTGEPSLLDLLAAEAQAAGLEYGRASVEAPEPQLDRAAELQAQWGTARGQLWQAGRHRLLCGDSTRAEDVARLMDGQRASLCVTSPPYWLGKEYEREHSWPDVLAFIETVAGQLVAATTHRIVLNTGAPPAAHLTGQRAHIRLLLDEWQRVLEQHGWLLRYVRIWAKRGGLLHTAPQSDCIDQHWEFIGVFYDPAHFEGQRRCGERWATDGIWDDLHGEMSAGGHVAAFPVEIPRRNIVLYTDPDALVFEPFVGSGSTMAAAEQTGRICYGLEIEPKYVAVALQRLADLGLRPERVDG